MTGPWEILETTEYADWFAGLTVRQQAAVELRLAHLRQRGPTTPRPYVDSIAGSRLNNLKELRISSGGALRVLFAFDPKRRAVLLIGGDKSESARSNSWYPQAIRAAEEIFRRHIERMDEEE